MKYAYAINDNGWIVGVVYDGQREKAALYQPDGTLLELGTLTGANTRRVALGINADNQIIAWSDTPDARARAFRWQNRYHDQQLYLGKTISCLMHCFCSMSRAYAQFYLKILSGSSDGKQRE